MTEIRTTLTGRNRRVDDADGDDEFDDAVDDADGAVGAETGRREPVVPTSLVVPFAAVLLVIIALIPLETRPGYEMVLFMAVSAFACVVAVHAARRRADNRVLHIALAASLTLWLIGDSIWWAEELLGSRAAPTLADVFFLLAFVPAAIAVWAMNPRRTRDIDRTAWIDTGILTLVVGAATWSAMIHPALVESGTSVVGRAVAIAYPVAALILVAFLVRFLIIQPGRTGFTVLFIAAVVVIGLGNGGVFDGDTGSRDWAHVCVLLAKFALAVAAVARIERPAAPDPDPDLGRTRLAIVLLAVLIPHLIAFVEVLSSDLDNEHRIAGIVLFSSAIMGLVAVRLWKLLHTARRREMRKGQDRLSALIHHSADAILLVDPDGTVSWASPAARRVVELACPEPSAERIESPSAATTGARQPVRPVSLVERMMVEDRDAFADRLHEAAALPPGDHLDVEVRIAASDLTIRVLEGTVTNMLDDASVEALVVTLRDVTARRSIEDELQHRAFHDELTGLANRSLFVDRLKHALSRRSRADDSTLAVLFIDLDDFKAINDGMGHQAGDQLLRAVAEGLRATVRPSDTVARLGGDEFAVLLDEIPSPDFARRVADRLAEVLCMPFDVGPLAFPAPGSVGVAVAVSGSTASSLMRSADIAMYRAKTDPAVRVAVFEPSLGTEAADRLQLKVELPGALAAEQFELHYQPILAVADGDVTSFEALLRWDHPDRGLIAPASFIPVAEETGTIVEIGRWVLQRACEQAVEWGQAAGRPIGMHVNVSAVQLRDAGFAADVANVLADTGLDGELLVLELTESVLADQRNGEELLWSLRQLGVGIAIDDFGTGYSSLAYIQSFPITAVKIDRSFIASLARLSGQRVVRTILSMAETLGYTTIAEGVEDQDQLELLGRLGCTEAQGFHLARPVPADDASGLLERCADARLAV